MSPEVAYLRARYDEEEADARTVPSYNGDQYGDDRQWVLDPQYDYHDHTRVLWISPAHVLADIAAKRTILDLHEQWPMLLQTPPVIEMVPHQPGQAWEANITQQIDWLTTQQYRRRFGDEPPTSPIIRALLQPYAARDDFDPAWRET